MRAAALAMALCQGCGRDRPVRLAPLADRIDVGFDVDVTLRARAHDPDGDPIHFAWAQIGGPRVPVSGARTNALRFRTRALHVADRFGPVAVPTAAADEYVFRVRAGTAERTVRVRAGTASPGWPRVETDHALELSCGRGDGEANWRLVEQPPASHGRIEDEGACRARLRPDRRGRYRVEEAGRPLTVYAGGYTGATECARSDCHGALGDAWRATKHAKVATGALEAIGAPAVLFAAAGVQCEHCHGPGKFWTGYRVSVCATCHASATLRQATAFASSPMSHRPSGDELAEGCASCHVAYEAVARLESHAPVAPREEPTDEGVTCAVCHDPHDATNPRQLRRVGRVSVGTRDLAAGAGAVCFACHGADRSRWRDEATFGVAPHAPQGWMIASGAAPHANVEDACVGCHFRGGDGLTVGGHTFAVQSGEAMNLVPCRACHERPSEVLGRVQAEITGATRALSAALGDALAEAGVRSCAGVLAAGIVDDAGRLAPADAQGHALRGCDGPIALPRSIAVAGAALLVLEGDGSRGVHDAPLAREVLGEGRRALGGR